MKDKLNRQLDRAAALTAETSAQSQAISHIVDQNRETTEQVLSATDFAAGQEKNNMIKQKALYLLHR